MVVECPICSKVLNMKKFVHIVELILMRIFLLILHHFKNLKIHFQELSVKGCLKMIKKI